MHDPTLRPHVPLVGVALALLLPALVAGVAALLIAVRGTPEIHLIGVPAGEFGQMRPASERDASITREEAFEKAKGPNRPDATARQVVLARYYVPYPEPAVERVVWVVNFANPDEAALGFIGGPPERDHSCDWAWHYTYVVTIIDAQTGDFVVERASAFFDPSLPPGPIRVGDPSDRAYCERLWREWQADAPSP
jgi:hypothetical protein